MAYPESLIITNPGAEAGDTTGWTKDCGTTAPGIKSTTQHSGTYSFVISPDSKYGGFRQDIDVSSFSSDIDAGIIEATLDFWLETYASDDDSARLVLEAYSSTGTVDETTFLSRWQTAWLEPDTWTEYNIAKYLPSGTRLLRIQVEGKRDSGTELSAYVDDITLTLDTPGRYRANLSITNPGINASSTTGWTVSNAGAKSTQYSGVPVPCAGYFYGGNSNASASMHQTINIPNSLWGLIDTYGQSSYSQSTPVGTEEVIFHIDAIAGSYDTNDKLKTTITFLDGLGGSLGTLVSSDKAWDVHWEPHELSVVPPQGARSIKIQFDFTRTDGSNNDGSITAITAYFTDTDEFAKAVTPDPADEETSVPIEQGLAWCGVGAESYDVYFGESSPPDFVQNQAGATYDPGTLDNNKTYYWRIDSLKSGEDTITGDEWSFTTVAAAETARPMLFIVT